MRRFPDLGKVVGIRSGHSHGHAGRCQLPIFDDRRSQCHDGIATRGHQIDLRRQRRTVGRHGEAAEARAQVKEQIVTRRAEDMRGLIRCIDRFDAYRVGQRADRTCRRDAMEAADPGSDGLTGKRRLRAQHRCLFVAAGEGGNLEYLRGLARNLHLDQVADDKAVRLPAGAVGARQRVR